MSMIIRARVLVATAHNVSSVLVLMIQIRDGDQLSIADLPSLHLDAPSTISGMYFPQVISALPLRCYDIGSRSTP